MGIFIVIAGGLADKLGRLRLTNIGIVPSIIGALRIALSPAGTAAFLMVGRVVLLRGTPESKAEPTSHTAFDWTGVAAFVVAMVSLNIHARPRHERPRRADRRPRRSRSRCQCRAPGRRGREG